MKQNTRHRDLVLSFLNGKQIEFKNSKGEWITTSSPMFNEDCEYRIAMYEGLKPFSSEDWEFLINKVVREKKNYAGGAVVGTIQIVWHNGVTACGRFYTYKSMLEDLDFIDGSPCGKREV
jgi:hypothetical protein